MVDYGWPRVKYEKNGPKHDFSTLFLDSYIDPGGPGSHPGGPRTDSRPEKHQKVNSLQFFHKFIFF